MYKTIILIAILFANISGNIIAQIHPAEGARLHYRLIGFSFPAALNTAGSKLEIAAGTYNSESEFRSNVIKSAAVKNNKIIIEVPTFGAEYTWRLTAAASTQRMANPFHHFTTLKSSNADTTNYRFRIVQSAIKYKDAYVFNDKTKTMYNMQGEPVWFLPNIHGIVEDNSEIRDIKLTPQNTITFLTYNMAYEINYDGEVLWRAPNKGALSRDAEEHYHHELTRLANGHYMVLGHEILKWKWDYSNNGDSSIAIVEGNENNATVVGKSNIPLRRMQMGTIIEYDSSGQIIWSWKSSAYYKNENLRFLQSSMGFIESHENAFFFDEKNKMLYVSFKNTNQVLKIKYPEGKVVHKYDGLELQTKVGTSMLALFSQQHACKVTSAGDLSLYNNNMANSFVEPQVLILQQPTIANGKLKPVWMYQYPQKYRLETRDRLTSGGNVIELPDHSFFVSSCTPYGNVFIVNREKKLLWDALLEIWNADEHKWVTKSAYRYSIITNRKNLEHLIHGENIESQ